MRVLCLWIFLLSSSSLLSLSGSLSVPASGDLSCTPSSAISASRLVVVKLGPCLRRGRFRRACDAERAKVRTDSDPPRCHSGGPACPARFWAAYCHASSGGTDKAVTAARSSTLSSVFQQTAHVSFGSEALSNAQSAIMFSVAPLTSLSAMRRRLILIRLRASANSLLCRPIPLVKRLALIRAGCARSSIAVSSGENRWRTGKRRGLDPSCRVGGLPSSARLTRAQLPAI